MLQLKSIRLFQFKNYLCQEYIFNRRIVGITGPNGTGKTNLLDAIYYLGFTRSYFHARETLNASHGQEAFRIEGLFVKNEKEERVSCVYRNGKKEVKLNDSAYDRFSHHIGLFPAVFIAPDDSILITGGSELRRKLTDVLLSQMEPVYLDHLIAYQKVLSQRNSLLKQAESDPNITALLDVFDAQLAAHGQPVFESRRGFLEVFKQRVHHYYAYISGETEQIDVIYDTALHQTDFSVLLQKSRRRDLVLQRTTSGIHRDDLTFLMNGYPLKQVGSQGQKKSFLFALKLAQFELLREHKGFPPVLLLDDVFEKLDQERVTRLIQLICGPGFGQVFITDTETARLKALFGKADVHLQMIELTAAKKPELK